MFTLQPPGQPQDGPPTFSPLGGSGEPPKTIEPPQGGEVYHEGDTTSSEFFSFDGPPKDDGKNVVDLDDIPTIELESKDKPKEEKEMVSCCECGGIIIVETKERPTILTCSKCGVQSLLE